MTRCPSSAGRGLSASLAFGVAKALLAFSERHARTRAVRFPGHAPWSVRMWEWYYQVICRMWCCASRASECITNESIVSKSTSNHELHEMTRLPRAERPPLILIQRDGGGYGYMTNGRAPPTVRATSPARRNEVVDLDSRTGVPRALWLDSEGAVWCVEKIDPLLV